MPEKFHSTARPLGAEPSMTYQNLLFILILIKVLEINLFDLLMSFSSEYQCVSQLV